MATSRKQAAAPARLNADCVEGGGRGEPDRAAIARTIIALDVGQANR
ncbi:MAG TPA: hypothetical protein VFF07_12560 [Actinomycetota bacterium]|nr:hypothetical protein [Actinomycetota bacterium]